MPTTGYYRNARIAVRRKKLFDSVFGCPYEDNPDHEPELINSLKNYVEAGDDIVVVGGGSGTTAVIAAKEAGKGGKVVCFEGSPERYADTKRTIKLNALEDQIEISHSIVGEALRIVGTHEEEISKITETSVEELPPCDVLELDCEGAEKKILENLQIIPDVIIVETHPNKGSGPESIKEILKNKGYIITREYNDISNPVINFEKN